MTPMLDAGTVLPSSEDRCFAVPKGQERIAQRFNAGLEAQRPRVPNGRLRSNPTPHPSAVSSGLFCHAGCFPALKRRAILKMSLRTKKSGGRLFRQESNPITSDAFKAISRLRCPATKMWDTITPTVSSEKNEGHVQLLGEEGRGVGERFLY